jgi:hypothetical protein
MISLIEGLYYNSARNPGVPSGEVEEERSVYATLLLLKI